MELKDSDLRRGNYVSTNDSWIEHEGLDVVISCLTPSQITFDKVLNNKDSWCLSADYKSFNPIIITEEWLKRINEVVNIDNSHYKIVIDNYRSIYFMIGESKVTLIYLDTVFSNEENNEFIPVDIKYIHQLQNYYYFNKLTGEELTLKKI